MVVTKALVLMSGGLDSILAAEVLLEQGIEVEAITFVTPFFDSVDAKKAATMLGIPVHIVDITDAHMKMLKHPKHGYGRFMNPCIDCHAMMIHKAGKLMKELGADFIATGEVLGERPKSQNRQALGIVEKESGMEGYVLRPLSAKLLDETIPEKEGLVDRTKLLDIRGRSRKPQMALAKKYGVLEYPSPAGGCILTDPMFSIRLRTLYKVEGEPTANEVNLMKIGRVFLSSEGAIIVVSRNEEENKRLVQLAEPGDIIFEAEEYAGPLTILLKNDFTERSVFEAAALTARYGKAKSLDEVDVTSVEFGTSEKRLIHVRHPAEAVHVNPPKDGELARVTGA
ncbi:MAG: tRNA 4-thiouridine(8) synthase ThiI [Candidatus Aquicultor sp.]